MRRARLGDALDPRRLLVRAPRPGNRVTALRNGDEAFRAMLEAIAGARLHVNLEVYALASDFTGWRFAEALGDRAVAGVEVNLIADAVGSFFCHASLLDFLTGKGARVLLYHPVVPNLRHLAHWSLNRRDHRKILVVDGEIGFLGGVNLTDDYLSTARGGAGWRDTHIGIEGPAVRELQRLFVANWNFEGGVPRLDPRRHLVEPRRAGVSLAQILGNHEVRSRRAIRLAYVRGIRAARSRVSITNAYFIPDRGIRRVLRNAAARGVEVMVIVSGRSDLKTVQYASRRLYARLLRSGVRILEWQEGHMHAKTAVIDGRFVLAGSYNIDHRSFLHNLEVSAAVLDDDFARRMEEVFAQDAARCREVKAGEWRRRPWWQKALEWLAYLFRYWL